MMNLLSKLMKPSDALDLEVFTDKLAENVRKIVRSAYEQALSYNHSKLTPEHLLIAFAKVEPVHFEQLAGKLHLDPRLITDGITSSLGQSEYKGKGAGIEDETRKVMSNALRHARAQGDGRWRIEAMDLMIGIFMDKDSYPARMIRSMGVEEEEVIRQIEEQMKQE
jgi:ATP-dependent Clp protease ATP-binding subunit ClpA